MTWQPYRFEDADFYSSSEAQAVTELSTLIPNQSATLRLRRAVGRVVAEFQGGADDVAAAQSPETRSAEEWLSLRYVGSAERDPWHGGKHVVRIRVGLGSRELQAVLEVPLESARSLIGRIVDVPATRLGASDLITPVEEGILSFFVERIVAGLAERVTELEPLLPLAVLECFCEQGEMNWGPHGIRGWVSLAGSVPLAEMNLPFRTLLPWQALRDTRERFQASADFSLHRDRRVQRMLGPLGGMPLTLTGRLGLATLESEELLRLEPTDILLFTAPGLTLTSGETPQLAGPIELAHSGWDRSLGALRGSLEDDGKQMRVRVEEQIPPACHRIEEVLLNSPSIPPEDPESTATGLESSPGSQTSGQELALGTPVQLRVELGQIKMTLRELSEISTGQILNLQKAPSAPVSLVVDDRVIGRGEIVQVEGELGVRISSLGPS